MTNQKNEVSEDVTNEEYADLIVHHNERRRDQNPEKEEEA